MTSCVKYFCRVGQHKRFSSLLQNDICKNRHGCQYSKVRLNSIIPSNNYNFTQKLSICTTNLLLKKARVQITFSKHDGKQLTATAKEGESLLDVVVNNDVDLKGYGACEGTLSCSTCHVIFTPEDFEKLKENPSDEELDMLDLALEVSPTSRLGCQVTVTKDMEGLKIQVPAVARDARENPVGSDSATT